ncbi:MAG: MogA/MoaB family molybdenum cofactor biosynthesis protein [Methanoregula sp.]|nr:MAG: MogA/MoaB family molybdenum cofactor biosynthesis protein [Methanoregula sp.]
MKPEHLKPLAITIGIITVSSSRKPDTDTSGMTITEIVKDAGFPVGYYAIVPDRIEAIRSEVVKAASHANCIIINGGTGLTHDDCTIEAVTPLLEKVIDGFGELFRLKSFDEIGTSSMLSRAVAGIYQQHVIFCIPGSTAAVRLATSQLIVPEIVHIMSHAIK